MVYRPDLSESGNYVRFLPAVIYAVEPYSMVVAMLVSHPQCLIITIRVRYTHLVLNGENWFYRHFFSSLYLDCFLI